MPIDCITSLLAVLHGSAQAHEKDAKTAASHESSTQQAPRPPLAAPAGILIRCTGTTVRLPPFHRLRCTRDKKHITVQTILLSAANLASTGRQRSPITGPAYGTWACCPPQLHCSAASTEVQDLEKRETPFLDDRNKQTNKTQEAKECYLDCEICLCSLHSFRHSLPPSLPAGEWRSRTRHSGYRQRQEPPLGGRELRAKISWRPSPASGLVCAPAAQGP